MVKVTLCSWLISFHQWEHTICVHLWLPTDSRQRSVDNVRLRRISVSTCGSSPFSTGPAQGQSYLWVRQLACKTSPFWHSYLATHKQSLQAPALRWGKRLRLIEVQKNKKKPSVVQFGGKSLPINAGRCLLLRKEIGRKTRCQITAITGCYRKSTNQNPFSSWHDIMTTQALNRPQ